MVGSDGVIEWDPFFLGNQTIQIFGNFQGFDLPYDNALFGLVYLMSPVGSEDSFPFEMVPFLGKKGRIRSFFFFRGVNSCGISQIFLVVKSQVQNHVMF